MHIMKIPINAAQILYIANHAQQERHYFFYQKTSTTMTILTNCHLDALRPLCPFTNARRPGAAIYVYNYKLMRQFRNRIYKNYIYIYIHIVIQMTYT